MARDGWLWVGVLTCGLAMGACGGDGDAEPRDAGGGDAGTGGDDAGPTMDAGSETDAFVDPAPQVVSVEPADGATAVEPDAVVTVTFSEPMDAASVQAALTLADATGAAMDAEVTVDGSVATLTPRGALPLADTMTVAVADTAADLDGSTLTSRFESTFDVRDGGWDLGEELHFETGTMVFSRVYVTLDQTGTGLAAWTRSEAGGGAPYTSVWLPHAADDGWGSAQVFPVANMVVEHLAMDDEGNAIVAYFVQGSDPTDLFVMHYSPDSGWGSPRPLESSSEYTPGVIDLAMTADGRAIAGFAQEEPGGTLSRLFVNVYEPTTDEWSGPQLVPGSGLDNDASVAVPPVLLDDGSIVAIWNEWEGTRYRPWASVKGTGGAWSSRIDIRGASVTSLVREAARGPSGEVHVVGTGGALWHNSYDPGAGGWGSSVVVSAGASGFASPRLAPDSADSVLCVFRQSGSGGPIDMLSTRYSSGAGWTSPVPIETEEANAGAASLSLRERGDGIAVWHHEDASGRDSILASRYEGEGAWTGTFLLESDGTHEHRDATVAMAENGVIAVLWRRVETTAPPFEHSMWGASFR